MLDPAVRRIADGTSLAHLATTLDDGAPHVVPVFVGVEGDLLAVFTDPASRKGRNLRRDPRVALSIAPADDPFTPVTLRGRVTTWVDDAAGWEIIDRIATKYTGQPYSREFRRAVALIEVDHQRVGIG